MASAACRVDVVLLNMNRKLILFLLQVELLFIFFFCELIYLSLVSRKSNCCYCMC